MTALILSTAEIIVAPTLAFTCRALLHPHPINFHDLTCTIEGIVIDAHLASPITAHSHIQNHIELVVEWPLVHVIRLLWEDLVHMIIACKEHDVRSPFHSVGVPIIHIHMHRSSDLRANAMVVRLRVYSSVDFARVVAHVLHDVDLATAGPPAIARLPWHHPVGCPSATGSSVPQASTNMEFAVQPICSALQFRRCKATTTVPLTAGTDLQCTIADKRVLLAIGVELKLVVAEAIAMAVDSGPL